MKAEILTIGDEICRGEIVDTNAVWLGAALWDLGIEVAWRVTCRDVASDIAHALRQAATRADLILCTGGLGPTEDDLTVDVVCELLGGSAVIDGHAEARMRARFAATGRADNPLMLRQTRRPADSIAWPNSEGLAPGFEVALGRARALFMPGVPREMKAIFDGGFGASLPQWIAARRGLGANADDMADDVVDKRLFRVFGPSESAISERLRDLAPALAATTVHYQVKFPEVLVKFVRRGPLAAAHPEQAAFLTTAVGERLGAWCYGEGAEALPELGGRLLRERGATVATAESCTGGLLAAMLTELPGASAYFAGGVVAYANREKQRLLGVPPEVLEEHGAVSEACVVAMARGARERFATDMAVAISGIAGPDGGTPDKPVGTVWLALAMEAGVLTRRLAAPGARDHIRQRAAWWGMRMIVAYLRGEALPP